MSFFSPRPEELELLADGHRRRAERLAQEGDRDQAAAERATATKLEAKAAKRRAKQRGRAGAPRPSAA